MKFGKWTVEDENFLDPQTRKIECICECGKKSFISKYLIKYGKSTKCRSCASREKAITHGYGTRGKIAPEYNSWAQMKTRCYNKKDKRYHRYGHRGICVHSEWINSFENFLSYIGKKPSKTHSLDRIDNDGNYEPGNIRWATPKEQANNRKKPR